jgi:hypothetical protein
MGESYPNRGTLRWIVTLDEEGSRVVLDDGSVWEVEPTERGISRTWEKTTTLTVDQPRPSAVRYRLRAESGEVVAARYRGLGPLG